MWSSGFSFVAPGTGLDFEATLNKPAHEFLLLIGAAPPSGRFEERRDNLCSALPSLMSKNIDWAIDCQRAACEMGIQDDDVWQYICMGWREAKPTEEQWSQVLAVIRNVQTPAPFFRRLPDTLEAWAKRKEDGVPQPLLAEMDDVALTCWQKALREDPASSEASKDWLSKAINRPGGSYAEYLLLRLEAIRKSGDDKMSGIPEPIRGALTEIIHSGSGSGEMGRVIIAAQLRWLHAIDPGFANAEVIPLFEWKADEKRAEQCWHGFLSWGHWSAPLVEKLLPHFTEAVRRLASQEKKESERMGERIAGHFAGLCLWFVSDPMADDWLLSCIRTMVVHNRRRFALEVKKQLARLSVDELEKRWEGWLCRYWTARSNGVPPIDPNEAKWMFEWAIYPHKYTPDVVRLALPLAAVAEFSHSIFTNELNESKILELYPTEAAQLLLAFLERSPKWFHVGDDSKELWAKLVKANVSSTLLEEIRDHLIRLGGNMDDFPQKGG